MSLGQFMGPARVNVEAIADPDSAAAKVSLKLVATDDGTGRAALMSSDQARTVAAALIVCAEHVDELDGR